MLQVHQPEELGMILGFSLWFLFAYYEQVTMLPVFGKSPVFRGALLVLQFFLFCGLTS